MAKVGIVIPCYNQGQYILQTLESISKSTFNDYEIIIVNDGSTDIETIEILNNLVLKNGHVITVQNGGLAYARNKGIEKLDCEFILPLDSDDTIHEEYIRLAMKEFMAYPEYDIVYCKANLFGQKTGIWNLPEFDIKTMLTQNCIFATAFYRKKMWQAVGGYNENMKHGMEDHDFWLSFLEKGANVKMIDKALFNYRVKHSSMVVDMVNHHLVDTFAQLIKNHPDLYIKHSDVLASSMLYDMVDTKLYIDIGNGINEQDCITKKINMGARSHVGFALNDRYQRNIINMRFDPVEARFCHVTIDAIIYHYKDGTSENISTIDCKINGIKDNNQMIFITTDPNIYLQGVKEKVICRVEVDMIVCHLNELGIRYTLKHLKGLIKTRLKNLFR